MAAVLLGVFAALSWSLHDLVARSFAARIGPFRMALAVMLAGGVAIAPVVLAHGTVWTASWPAVMVSLLLGVAYGMGVGSLFKAFSLGPISLVGPLTAAYPALVVLWGVANGLSPSALQWAAIAATLIGAVTVARSGHEDGGINAVARKDVLPLVLFCLLASVGYAAAVVIGQNAAVQIGEFEATWLSRATAALVLLPFLAGEDRPPGLSLRHWLGIAAMALLDVAGLTAVNLSGFLPEHDFAAIGISAYGAIAVILAALVLKERVSPGQWAGIVLIVTGVAVVSVG
jgi:drug/metabolite transporter (DMT)-like permease